MIRGIGGVARTIPALLVLALLILAWSGTALGGESFYQTVMGYPARLPEMVGVLTLEEAMGELGEPTPFTDDRKAGLIIATWSTQREPNVSHNPIRLTLRFDYVSHKLVSWSFLEE